MKNQEITLGTNLRREIERREITQKELSRLIGMRQSTLHNYLYGVVPNGLQNVIKLAQYLGLSLDELVLDSSIDIFTDCGNITL